ncbi:flavodoxin domain-containing protein [Corallococcus terminator]|uniref:Flavodoxin n=1 Tax=Corallococcus terminator TaxID=2316733 RepID=A0A3A8IP83_9BACT|nr:flavodoxin domain-containing protein [Corallococcus terminator]RKG81714.1 flavodoxin [Corallococcus terminator]
MRVLVTYGSKRGGTEGIARWLAQALRDEGLDAEVAAPQDVGDVSGYGAVIVGGSLYANRWHRDARRFVHRHARRLRERPTWFFSSGPLDASASDGDLPPTPQVRALMEQVHASGHMTFGGRLEADARGFLARSMAREHAGDWRDLEQLRRWAASLAEALALVGDLGPAPRGSESHVPF